MTILNQDGQPINGDVVGPARLVEKLVGRSINQIGKNDLCRLIASQYLAVQNLMVELHRVDPDNAILPKQTMQKSNLG